MIGIADCSLAIADSLDRRFSISDRRSAIVYIRATCSAVGSAQQYQGSFRYGIAARATSVGWRRSRRPWRAGARAPRSWRNMSRTSTRQLDADQPRQLRLQRVHGRIGVRPRIRQRPCIERARSPRARRRAPACRDPCGISSRMAELDRRDVFDEVQPIDRVQQIEIALDRRPRRERHERRRQRDAGLPAQRRPPARSRRACAPSPASRARRSSTDSTAVVTNAQPVSPQHAAACRHAAAGARP